MRTSLTDDGCESPCLSLTGRLTYFRSHNYIGIEPDTRTFVQKVGGFRSESTSAQDYDPFFVSSSRLIGIHVPRCCTIGGEAPSSSAISVRQKPGQSKRARMRRSGAPQRKGIPGHVAIELAHHHVLGQTGTRCNKQKSIIIWPRDRLDLLSRCVESLSRKNQLSQL